MHKRQQIFAFIFKLTDIIQKFPDLIKWIDDGSSIEFLKIEQIQSDVLPLYFRHSNFESFVRQLHLYDFKQDKDRKKRHIFSNIKFRLGNQKQFKSIQRIKKKKLQQQIFLSLENNNTLKQVCSHSSLSSSQKIIITELFSYKLIILGKQKQLGEKLNKIIPVLKSTRNKEILQQLRVIEEEVYFEFEEIKNFSQSIDMFLTNSLEEIAQRGIQTDKEHKKNPNAMGNLRQKQHSNLLNLLELQSSQLKQAQYAHHAQQAQMTQQAILQSQSVFGQKGDKDLKHPKSEIVAKHVRKRQTNNNLGQIKSYINQQIIQQGQCAELLYKDPSCMYLPMNYYKKSCGQSFWTLNQFGPSNAKPQYDSFVQSQQFNRPNPSFFKIQNKESQSRESIIIQQATERNFFSKFNRKKLNSFSSFNET